ncbi:MAG TPA: hypothetical protein VHO01_05370 [Jatrophihabitans sp.]|nr:hypothetical protein [Jatrophihabitans sp.]
MSSGKAIPLSTTGTYDAYQVAATVGTWTKALSFRGGASLGIANIKPGTFDEVKRLNPALFSHADWSQLGGDEALSALVVAEYVEHIQVTYVAHASAAVQLNYTPAEIVYGIYNGGEKDYVTNVQNTGVFGGNPSKYLPGFEQYYDVAGASLGAF